MNNHSKQTTLMATHGFTIELAKLMMLMIGMFVGTFSADTFAHITPIDGDSAPGDPTPTGLIDGRDNDGNKTPIPEITTDLGKSKILLVNGTEIEATIKSIDQDGNIQGTEVPDGLNIREVLSLNTSRRTRRVESNNVSVFLVGGGRVYVSKPEITNETVSFRSDSGMSQLSLQAARAIVWSNSPMVQSTLSEPSKQNDIVIVATDDGDRSVQGILESIDSEFVQVKYKGESRKIGLAKVKAVVMADLGLSKPDGSSATVQLVDESMLVGVIVGIAEDQLTLNVAAGTSLDLTTSNIAAISIASDRLLYLSDIEPVEVQEKAIFAIQRPWKRDRSVENNALKIRLAGSAKTVSFTKGLGTQASSRLVFANTNDFDRFGAVVGIAAETGGRGDCQMVVRGDGIELWSKRIRGAEGPQEVDVDITGMDQIVLLVYPGEEFDLGDHANWCEARFLKTK